jgi:hypothetical protein
MAVGLLSRSIPRILSLLCCETPARLGKVEYTDEPSCFEIAAQYGSATCCVRSAIIWRVTMRAFSTLFGTTSLQVVDLRCYFESRLETI